VGAGAEPDGTGCGAKPPKTQDNSSLPLSKGQKPNQPEKAKHVGPRKGGLGRKGGGRPLACDPDETVTAKPVACVHGVVAWFVSSGQLGAVRSASVRIIVRLGLVETAGETLMIGKEP
jgi:hypothetical protein